MNESASKPENQPENRLADKPVNGTAHPQVGALPGMDLGGMYKIEIITDLRVSELRFLTPILADCTYDPSRPIRFFSHVTMQLHGPHGIQPLRVDFELPAKSLAEAVEMFSSCAQRAGEKFNEEMQARQRKAAILGANGMAMN